MRCRRCPSPVPENRRIKMKTSMLVAILLALFSLSAWGGDQSKASQAELSKEAKITMEQARKVALAKEAGTITEGELEREKGRLIYSFDIKMADGIHEVNVDAKTGEIVDRNSAGEGER